MRAAARTLGGIDRQEVLDEDDLDRPEQRRPEDHRLALAEDDGAELSRQPGLPAEQEADRERVRPPEALLQQRNGEQRDPDDRASSG